jgi:putative flippase GtrA
LSQDAEKCSGIGVVVAAEGGDLEQGQSDVLTRLAAASPVSAQFMRFVLVGGASAILYSTLTAWLVGFRGMPPIATSTVVYALCIPLAYLAHKSFTFRAREVRRSGFLVYGAMQVMFIALASVVTTRFVTGNMIADTALFLLTSIAVAVASYAVSRVAVFR